jgi:hypothetical protein
VPVANKVWDRWVGCPAEPSEVLGFSALAKCLHVAERGGGGGTPLLPIQSPFFFFAAARRGHHPDPPARLRACGPGNGGHRRRPGAAARVRRKLTGCRADSQSRKQPRQAVALCWARLGQWVCSLPLPVGSVLVASAG